MEPPILQDHELPDLTKRVANLYDFISGPRDRRVIVQQAGLSRFLIGIDLSGAPGTVAGDLIGRLDTHGFLSDRPTYHALGALLAYVLTLPDLAEDDARFVAGLIVRHGLVRDPAYIAELQTRFDIVEPPPADLSPATPAVPPGSFRPEPEFSPQIADAVVLEKVLNSEDNFLDLHLLVGAIYAGQAVGRVELPQGNAIGTGFLIGPSLLLTNQHVLRDRDEASEAVVRFGYIKDRLDVNQFGQEVRIQPGFYEFSPQEQLDYALVRLEVEPLAALKADNVAELSAMELIRVGKHRGYLTAMPHFIALNQRVNILQHPRGAPLKVVLTQNRVTANMTATRVHYVADTDDGSSGSPVFNEKWEVVALHHGHQSQSLGRGAGPGRISYINEGIPMRAILADLKKKDLERLLPRS